MSFVSISFLLEKGSLDLSITSAFYASVFFLLILSVYNTFRKELTEDYLIRDNIFLWYITGFVGSRLAVATSGIVGKQRQGEVLFIPIKQVFIGGYHLHHYLWGIGLITLVSVLSLEEIDIDKTKLGLMFGLGLGMLMDEIGLLVSLENYYSPITYPIAASMAFILFLNTERDIARKGVRRLKAASDPVR
jgi:hypothetical protein